MIGYPFITDKTENFIEQLTKISSGIMELYMCILILYASKKNVIIYAGFYHSNNIAYILEHEYQFKTIYKSGFTDNVEKEYATSNNNNCVHIDKSQFNFLQ